jgi:hypothetical protein
MSKALFFEAWPVISRWIRDDRRAGEMIINFHIAQEMCVLQRDYLLQVTLLRFKLNKSRKYCRIRFEEPQDPNDPYRGWAGFFWIDYYHGPRTPEENWVLAVLRRVYGAAEDAFYHMSQAQVIAQTVRASQAIRLTTAQRPLTNYVREAAPQGAPPPRITQVPRDPPDVNEYGRQFSADEAGDGPGCWEPFRAWAILVRHRRSLTTEQEVQTDLDETRLPVGRAEVRPNCDVCSTPCYVYRWCRFCRQENVMHHGRCCWYNPGWRE